MSEWWDQSKSGTVCAEPDEEGEEGAKACREMPIVYWLHRSNVWSGDCPEHDWHGGAVPLKEVPEHLQVERDEALMKAS